MAFRADLHCHTTASDGSDTPKELIQKAVEAGLNGLSITDHDTIDAYAEALPEAERLGLKLLPGVEFSSSHEGTSIHILAYAFPIDSKPIIDLCKKQKLFRVERNIKIIDLLQAEGIDITIDDVIEEAGGADFGTVGRPHIAQVLYKKGVVSNFKDAFGKYIAEGKKCYTPGNKISVDEVLSVIKEGKGLASLAHPHLIRNQQVVQQLIAKPFDGIECYYAIMSPKKERPWLNIAQGKNLIPTGGSDYHGSVKPHIPLGASWVSEDTFNRLYSHYETVGEGVSHD